jgi:ribose transport system substrate-binding protein
MLSFCWRLSALVALGGFAALAGCNKGGPGGDSTGPATSSGGTKRIVFMTNGNDPFWDTCNAGLKEAATELKLAEAGYSAQMDKANFTAEGQIDKLRQYATEPDIVGVAISVFQADNKTLADELRKLQAAGKKVITVDSDVNRERHRDARSYYIGTDNLVGGQVLGTAARAALQSKGKTSGGYVQFVGATDVDNGRGRMNGVQEKVGKEYEQLDRMPDAGKHDKARDNVRTALDNHGDKLVAVFGIWAYNAPAIADVVAERKVRDKLIVATFDADADAIKAMDEGNIDVMVVQNPFDMGYQSVKLLKAMCENDQSVVAEMFPKAKEPDGDIYTTGLRVVVPAEGSPIKPDLFDPKVVEFMTLPQFQAWLKKYDLRSS